MSNTEKKVNQTVDQTVKQIVKDSEVMVKQIVKDSEVMVKQISIDAENEVKNSNAMVMFCKQSHCGKPYMAEINRSSTIFKCPYCKLYNIYADSPIQQ